jgi:nicotinamidase-related amidase
MTEPIRLPSNAGLVIIDMQRAIDDPFWAAAGPRNNPGAEAALARLLAAWRQAHRPIFHVRHDSPEPGSTFRPGGVGHAFKPESRPRAGETVLGKTTCNAFLSTELESRLRRDGIDTIVVAGVITNNSVEATVRMAGELGFAVWLAEDACFTFARRDRRGVLWPAEDVHALSLANLEQGGYCRIATSRQLAGADA